MSGERATTRRNPTALEPARFGGWTDYREWAEHDFRDRAPAEEPGPGAQHAIVVEALTDFVPIKVLVEEENTGDRKGRLMPSNGLASPDPVAESARELGDSALIRPYVRGGDPSDVAHDIEFETLVQTARPYAALPIKDLNEDQLYVCRLCIVPQSIAEVAVAISAPLELARTIVGEAIAKGYLRVHETASIVDGLPEMSLLRRVYSGLAKLPEAR